MGRSGKKTSGPGRAAEHTKKEYGSGREADATSRYHPENIRTGSRYDPENIKSGSRYGREDREESAKQSSQKERKEKGAFGALLRRRDPAAVIMTVLAGLLALAYLVLAVFFARRFYPGTTIQGVNCTAKDVNWVKEQVQKQVESERLVLRERYDVSEALTAESIDLRYVDDGAIEKRLRSQYSLLWPVMMLVRRGTRTEITTTYDKDKVEEALLGLGCFHEDNVIAPANAYIRETDSGYEIVPEVMGTRLDLAKVKETVIEALDRADTEVFLEFHDCYIDPVIYADDSALHTEADLKNDLLGADLVYDFVDRQEKVDPRRIMTFITEDGAGGYAISEEAVYRFANELADTYDTFGGTRTYNTRIGTTETLYGGDYGWAMDREATGRELLAAIREKRTGRIEPVYMYTACSRASNDIGDTYIEICIARQQMWCFKDGELIVDTPVVTGNPNKGNATPAGGVWAIDAKEEKAVLVGEGYRQPVDYWMPFNGNVGIHDLQTRYWFGSTIYLTNGSHGCVNTPLEAVRRIYEAVEVGTPVIVYEGEI